uniref:Uncharacterized protein n=1 Tax=Podoviridae sp. ctiJY10 TaxID=2826572 RepID=A0A8S5N594_9CAUD|nr:MAG TPA: hypothetical protein [Podoviridae sp. ctiJY10]
MENGRNYEKNSRKTVGETEIYYYTLLRITRRSNQKFAKIGTESVESH